MFTDGKTLCKFISLFISKHFIPLNFILKADFQVEK